MGEEKQALKKVEGEKPRGVETATPFHCSTPVQIRYTDLDLQGHVNNSVYLNFFDLAKIDYFNRVKGATWIGRMLTLSLPA